MSDMKLEMKSYENIMSSVKKISSKSDSEGGIMKGCALRGFFLLSRSGVAGDFLGRLGGR